MKKTIRSLFTVALSLAALCATGSAWAATPVAVWNGFKDPTSGTFSAYLGSNTVDENTGAVTLGSRGIVFSNAGEIWAGSKGITVAVKYSNFTSGTAAALVALQQNNEVANKLGAWVDAAGKVQGIWQGNAYGTADKTLASAGTFFVVYKDSDYTHVYDQSGAQLYYGSGLRSSSQNWGREFSVGSFRDGTSNVASGMTIEKVAVFDSAVSVSDIQSFEWPDPPKTKVLFHNAYLTTSWVDTGWDVADFAKLKDGRFVGEMVGSSMNARPVYGHGANVATGTNSDGEWVSVEIQSNNDGHVKELIAVFQVRDNKLMVNCPGSAYKTGATLGTQLQTFDGTNRVLQNGATAGSVATAFSGGGYGVAWVKAAIPNDEDPFIEPDGTEDENGLAPNFWYQFNGNTTEASCAEKINGMNNLGSEYVADRAGQARKAIKIATAVASNQQNEPKTQLSGPENTKTSAFTVSCIAKLTALQSENKALLWCFGTSGECITLAADVANGNIEVCQNNSTAKYSVHVEDLTTAFHTYVVVGRSNNTVDFYIDGEKQSGTGTGWYPNTQKTAFGLAAVGNSGTISGMSGAIGSYIDDFRVYRGAALSDDEVAKIGKNTYSPVPTKATVTIDTDTTQWINWGDIQWTDGVAPSATLPAEITLTGSNLLTIMQNSETDAITAKGITFKGTSSAKLMLSPLLTYNGGKIISGVPFELQTEVSIDVDVGANDLTYSYAGAEISPTLTYTGNFTKAGSGTISLNHNVPSGKTLTVAVGTLKFNHGGTKVQGNIKIESGATLLSTGTDVVDWGSSNTIDVYGTLNFVKTRWTFQNNVLNIYPGATITGDSSDVNGGGSINFIENKTVYMKAEGGTGDTAEISAIIAPQANKTTTFDVPEGKVLVFSEAASCTDANRNNIFAKSGTGTLYITGKYGTLNGFTADAGVVKLGADATLPATTLGNGVMLDISALSDSAASVFANNLTIASGVSIRFPANWEETQTFTLCAGTLNAPASERNAPVYIGNSATPIAGAVLTYNATDKTVSYTVPTLVEVKVSGKALTLSDIVAAVEEQSPGWTGEVAATVEDGAVLTLTDVAIPYTALGLKGTSVVVDYSGATSADNFEKINFTGISDSITITTAISVDVVAGDCDLIYNYTGATSILPKISVAGDFTKGGSGTIAGLDFGTGYTGQVTIKNGTVSTAKLQAFGNIPYVQVVYPAVWELVKNDDNCTDDREVDASNVTGDGTIRIVSTAKWRALPWTQGKMWANTLGIQSEAGDAVIISEGGFCWELGSVSGTKNFRSDYGNSSAQSQRQVRFTQSRNTTWSGKFQNNRIDHIYVAGADDAEAKTLEIAGAHDIIIPLDVESTGSVKLTGTWQGSVTVAGELGGAGSVTGASAISFANGATIRADWGAVTLSATPSFGATLKVVGGAVGTTILKGLTAKPAALPQLVDLPNMALKYENDALKIAEAEAQVNGKSYATLAEAIAAAASGDKITICKSLTDPTINTSTKNIAIEFADGVSISGTITKAGSGTLTLPSTCTIPVTLNGGMINANATNTVTLNGTISPTALPLGWTIASDSTGTINLPTDFESGSAIAKVEEGTTELPNLTVKMGDETLEIKIEDGVLKAVRDLTNTWIGGGANTNWATVENWSKEHAPTENEDVVISKDVTISSVISTAKAKSITLTDGAKVTLKTANTTAANIHDITVPAGTELTIYPTSSSTVGSVSVAGKFFVDGGTSTLTLAGGFEGDETSSVEVKKGTLKVASDMTTGSLTFAAGTTLDISSGSLPEVLEGGDATFGETLTVIVSELPEGDAAVQIVEGTFEDLIIDTCWVAIKKSSTTATTIYNLKKDEDGVWAVKAEKQCLTWNLSGSSTLWSVATNWKPTIKPTANYDVVLPDGATITSVDSSSTAKSVTLEGSATLKQGGDAANLNNITIPEDGVLTVSGAARIFTTTDLVCKGTFIKDNTSTTAKNLNLKGTVSGGGAFMVKNGALAFDNNATIDLSSGAFTVDSSEKTFKGVTFGSSLNIVGGEVGGTVLTGLSNGPTQYPTTVKLDGVVGDYKLKYDEVNQVLKIAREVSFSVPAISGATTSIEGGTLSGTTATVDYGADATITYTANSGKLFNDGETTKSVELKNITDGTAATAKITDAIKDLSTTDAEARIDDVYYLTLDDAVEAAQDDDTITILVSKVDVTINTENDIAIALASGISISGTITKEGSGTLTLPTTCMSAVTLSGGMINIDAKNTVTLDEVEIDLTTVEKLPISWTIDAASIGEIHLPMTYEYGKRIVKFNGEAVPEGLIAMVGEAKVDLRVEFGYLIAEEFLIKWKGETGGSWDEATNWTLGAVPTIADEVIIPDGSEIALTSDSTAASVVLQGDATFTIAATDTDIATFGAISGDDGCSLTINGGALASSAPIAVDLTFGDGVTLDSSNPLTIADGKTVTFGEKVYAVGAVGNVFISNLDEKPSLPGVISPTTSLKSFTYEAGAIKLADGAVATIPAGTDVAGYASLADAIASAADGALITVRVVGGAGKVIDVPEGKTVSLAPPGRPAINIFDTSLTKTGAGTLKYAGSIDVPVTIEEGAIIHNPGNGNPLTVNGNLTFGDKAVIDVTAAEGPSTKYMKVGSGKSVTFGEELTVNLDTTVAMGTDVKILGGIFEDKIIKTTKLNILVNGTPFTGDKDGLVIKMKGDGVYVGYYVNEWKGASGGSWDNAENWSQGLPTADMLVAIPNGANIKLSSASTAGEIKLQGNATFTIASGDIAMLGTISGVAGYKLTVKGGALASNSPIAVDLTFGDGATLDSSHPLTIADGKTVVFGATVNAIGVVGDTFINGLAKAPSSTPTLVGDSTKMLMYENGAVKLAEIVASVGGKYYATIDAAIEATSSGNTITVLASLDNPTIDTQKKNITISFSGVGAFNEMITKAGEGMLTLPEGCPNPITLAGGMIDRTIANTVTLKGVTIDLTGFDPEDTSTPLGWMITSGSSATIKLPKDFAAGREIVKVESGATTTTLAGVFVMIDGKDYNIVVANDSLSATEIDDDVLIWRGGTGDPDGRIWTTLENWVKADWKTVPTGAVPKGYNVIIPTFGRTIIGGSNTYGETGVGNGDTHNANSIRLGGDATVTIKVSPSSKYFHDLTIPAGATLSLTNSSSSGTIGKTTCYGTLVIDGSTSSSSPASLTIGDEFTCGNNAKIRVNSSKFATDSSKFATGNYTVNADIEFGDAAIIDAGTKTADTPLKIGAGKTVTFAKSLVKVTVKSTEESPRAKIIDIKDGKINIGDEGVIFPLYAWNGKSSTSFVGLGHLEWDTDGVYAVWDVDGGYYTWTGKVGNKNWGTDANWIPMVKPDEKSDVFLPNGAEIEIAGNASKAKSITLAENAMAKFMLDGENIKADRFHDITIPLGSTLTVNSTKSFTSINNNNSIGNTSCLGTFIKDGAGALLLGGGRFDGGGTVKVENGTLLMTNTLLKIDAELEFGAGATIDTTLGVLLSIGEGRTVTFGSALTIKISQNTLPPAGKKMLILEGSFDDEIVEGCALTVKEGTKTHTGEEYQLKKGARGIYLSVAGSTDRNEWIGGASGDWDDPSNWSRDEVPATDDNIPVVISRDATINLSASSKMSSIELDGNVTFVVSEGATLTELSGDYTLTKIGAGTLTLAGDCSFFAGELVVAEGLVKAEKGSAYAMGGIDIWKGATFDIAGAKLSGSSNRPMEIRFVNQGEGEVGVLSNSDSSGATVQNASIVLKTDAKVDCNGGNILLTSSKVVFNDHTLTKTGSANLSGVVAANSVHGKLIIENGSLIDSCDCKGVDLVVEEDGSLTIGSKAKGSFSVRDFICRGEIAEAADYDPVNGGLIVVYGELLQCPDEIPALKLANGSTIKLAKPIVVQDRMVLATQSGSNDKDPVIFNLDMTGYGDEKVYTLITAPEGYIWDVANFKLTLGWQAVAEGNVLKAKRINVEAEATLADGYNFKSISLDLRVTHIAEGLGEVFAKTTVRGADNEAIENQPAPVKIDGVGSYTILVEGLTAGEECFYEIEFIDGDGNVIADSRILRGQHWLRVVSKRDDFYAVVYDGGKADVNKGVWSEQPAVDTNACAYVLSSGVVFNTPNTKSNDDLALKLVVAFTDGFSAEWVDDFHGSRVGIKVEDGKWSVYDPSTKGWVKTTVPASANSYNTILFEIIKKQVRYSVQQAGEEGFVVLSDSTGKTGFSYGDSFMSSKVIMGGVGFLKELRGTQNSNEGAETIRAIGHKGSAQEGYTFETLKAALDYAKEHKWEDVAVTLRTNADISTKDLPILDVPITIGAGGYKFRWTDDGTGDKSRYIKYDAESGEITIVKGSAPNGIDSFTSYALQLDPEEPTDKPVAFVPSDDGGDYLAIEIKKGSEDGDELEPREGFEVKYIAVPVPTSGSGETIESPRPPIKLPLPDPDQDEREIRYSIRIKAEEIR